MTIVTRRKLIRIFATLALYRGQRAPPQVMGISPGAPGLSAPDDATRQTGGLPRSAKDRSTPSFPGVDRDYHGYLLHEMTVDSCTAYVVEPENSLPGKPWIWRTMFWDAFPAVDVAILRAGFHLAFIDVGNTFGCPDAMRHFDVFYRFLTADYSLYAKPALEGLSRGGLYVYRWAYANSGRVGCIYGDAPVCDLKSWPGGKGKGIGSPDDWREAIKAYHFTDEQEMLDFRGNPVDILDPIAAEHIPILHVCGDSDTVVPEDENTDIVRKRYMALGGEFALIVKQGCGHHPHGLSDPSPIVNFILAHSSEGETARLALTIAPKPGSILKLAIGQW